MKAVSYYVVIEKIKEKKPENKGFVISEHQDKDNAYLQGKVISKGELVESIEKGDIVWYNKHSGHTNQRNKKLYYVIKYGDIVIVE